MNNAELYQRSNTMQKRDALHCLEEYAKKIKWKNDGDTVIDIGCGDGSVTSGVLKKFLPCNYKRLVGCDISEGMVQFANKHHAAPRTSFAVLDIEGELPDRIKGNFDHAFSFYTLHWIKHQETAFTNIYRLLVKGGDCLLIFLAHMPVYDVYRILARTARWSHWLRDVDRFVSPYHDSQDPEKEIKRMMTTIGFTGVEVKCVEKSFIYTSVEALKKAVNAVNPFKIPAELQEDFLEDYVKIVRDMQLIDHVNNNINDNRSEVSLRVVQSATKHKEDVYVPPLDDIAINILDVRVPDAESKPYVIVVTFFDQLLISSVVASTGGREVKQDRNNVIACGQMSYDPSDYEKMCLFADNPLIIKIHPLRSDEKIVINSSYSSSTKSSSLGTVKPDPDTYCCNIDILPIFTEINKMILKKRLEPMFEPSVLLAKSWDNLPLVTISLKAIKNPANVHHHKMFKNANYMKVTLVGMYNMLIPFEDEYVYTAASKLPLQHEMHTGVFCFNNGYRLPRRFNSMSFYPHWESMRLGEEIFTRGDEKFESSSSELRNEENIDLNYYINEKPKHFTALWASFHRVLMLKDTEELLAKHIRQYKWPIEMHIYSENNKGYSFMGFVDLFHLLYPGEKTARLVVPLQWIDAQSMMAKCACQLLLTPTDKASSIVSAVQKSTKSTPESAHTSTVTEITYVPRSTGSDENCSFVIVEVSLARAFIEPCIPPHLSESAINDMLIEMEAIPTKRECTGRGQLDRDWRATVRGAANALRRVPYFGLTDLCTINRQLSESRTRVELVTSFWQDAAIYVNNNFVIRDFLHSDNTFEEMLMIAHACLVRLANETLQSTTDNRQELNPILRAARHARHLQDLPHAMDLYLQVVASKPREANSWRELATCLRDVDDDWANVCINKAIMLNPRHPLRTEAEGLSQEMAYPRAWERELGDWWDNTPLLPGTSRYYDAADLLLRIRAVSLAEICIARAFLESGESAVYHHMVALCCRIRGNVDDALCHIKQGIEKYGEVSNAKCKP